MVDSNEFIGYAIYYVIPCLEEMLEYMFGKEKKENILGEIEKLWELILRYVSENGLKLGHTKSVGLGNVEATIQET